MWPAFAAGWAPAWPGCAAFGRDTGLRPGAAREHPGDPAGRDTPDQLAVILRGAVFPRRRASVWITPHPVSWRGRGRARGNLVNQIAYSFTAVLCFATLLFVDLAS